MSQKKVDAVRQPLGLTTHSRRRLVERLGLRFPDALAFVAAVAWRLPARSRLRQAVVRRAMRLSIEAANRGDYAAAFALLHPDCESTLPPQAVAVGEPGTHGPDERADFERRWHAEWGEMRYVPEELIHLGDRVLLVGRITGSGRGSGAPADPSGPISSQCPLGA